jgi:hypothetical protein
MSDEELSPDAVSDYELMAALFCKGVESLTVIGGEQM